MRKNYIQGDRRRDMGLESGSSIFPGYLSREYPFEDILELGSGEGKFIEDCLGTGFNIYGIELREMLDNMENRNRLIMANACNLPFKENSFDLVRERGLIDDIFTLQERPDLVENVLSETERVLREKGYFISASPVMVDSRFFGNRFEFIKKIRREPITGVTHYLLQKK